MVTRIDGLAQLRNLGLLWCLALAACGGPSEAELREKVLVRVRADSDLHKAVVLRMTNIFAPEDDGNDSKAKRGTFQRLELDNGQCILIRDAGVFPFSSDLDKRLLSYRSSSNAAQTWPITLFALDRDCLPAELES